MEKKSTEDWRLDEPIVVNNAKKNADSADLPLNEPESYQTVIIREHETKHHGHSHSHGTSRENVTSARAGGL